MKTFQARLTEEELISSLKAIATRISLYGVNEYDFDRFNYLGKRLLKIQKGEPEIENENLEAKSEQAKTQGWN